MAIEKKWERQGPVFFTQDGTEFGLIRVSSVELFKVKQKVAIGSDTQPLINLEIKRIPSLTEIIVGPGKDSKNRKITSLKARYDLSAYTAADNAFIRAEEQSKVTIPEKDIVQAVYEFEPTVAVRTFSVDRVGNPWSESNPFPVQLSDGSINVGTVNAEVEVQLSRRDNFPDAGDVHDSTRIGNQDYELTFTANDNESKAAADIVALNKLIDVPHDDIEITQFTLDGDPEIIEFRDNSNLKLTLNLTYNSEGELQRVQRSKP